MNNMFVGSVRQDAPRTPVIRFSTKEGPADMLSYILEVAACLNNTAAGTEKVVVV